MPAVRSAWKALEAPRYPYPRRGPGARPMWERPSEGAVRRGKRAAILAHDKFGPFGAKTGVCVIRYSDYRVVCVVDRSKAGRHADEFMGPDGSGIPIVASVKDALRFAPEVLVVGIAPVGGDLPAEWRPELELALKNGVDVVSGLHFFLSEDRALAALAASRGRTLWDVRKPPGKLRIATGEGRDIEAPVVLTVGTDTSSGKMTTAVELVRAARARGIDVAFVATGQTGIMIGCDAGVAVDRVISDFVAGETERMVLDVAGRGKELIVVEGQASLGHPAYSGVALSLLHGSFPDALVMGHQPTRTAHAFPSAAEFPLLPLRQEIELNERLLAPLTGGKVVAVSLVTPDLDDAGTRREVERVQRELGLPACDVVKQGAAVLLDAVLARMPAVKKAGARRLAERSAAAARRPSV